VATINSAHIASVLRRIASLQREEDAGAVQATQNRSVATLRMRHDPHHVATGVADAGYILHRTVRILCDIPQHDLPVDLELGGGLCIRHVTAVPVRDRQHQLLAAVVAARERRVGRVEEL